MSLDRAIADLARRQHGLITVGQIAELGGDRGHLDRRVGRGVLEQLNHSVFRVAGVPPTWESLVLAAVLGAGPGAVASHLTAAALWDLDGFSRAGQPEISIPRGRRYRPQHARCHESTDLDRCERVVRYGIPTTELTRTLLDLGRYHGVRRLDRIVEGARRSHALDPTSLLHTLMAHARQGRHGIRRTRTVLSMQLERTEVTDSDFELLVLVLLAERGVPKPLLHHRIHVGEVLIAEVDLAWPDRRVAVELNGGVHRQEDVWERDQVRLVELTAMGWTVLPFTWHTYVSRTEWMVRRIRQALTA